MSTKIRRQERWGKSHTMSAYRRTASITYRNNNYRILNNSVMNYIRSINNITDFYFSSRESIILHSNPWEKANESI